MRTALLTIALLLTLTGVAGATCCGGGGEVLAPPPEPAMAWNYGHGK